jgi:type III secretory pathway component EscR
MMMLSPVPVALPFKLMLFVWLTAEPVARFAGGIVRLLK